MADNAARNSAYAYSLSQEAAVAVFNFRFWLTAAPYTRPTAIVNNLQLASQPVNSGRELQTDHLPRTSTRNLQMPPLAGFGEKEPYYLDYCLCQQPAICTRLRPKQSKHSSSNLQLQPSTIGFGKNCNRNLARHLQLHPPTPATIPPADCVIKMLQ